MIFFIKMIIHLEKTTMNNIVHLEFIKKEVVRPRNAFYINDGVMTVWVR